MGTTLPRSRIPGTRVETRLHRIDVIGVDLLDGIGFTAAPLIGELALTSTTAADHVKVAVLSGSLLSAALGTAVLSRRNRAYRRAAESANSTAAGDDRALST